MSDATERIKALARYCAVHRCEDCPMNDPQLGCIDNEDDGECVVALALDALRPGPRAKS